VAFTRELAVELGPKNIRVNAIAPGGVKVENWEKVGDMDLEQQARSLPVGFIAEPWDIARLCIFLASNEARYICGQTIVSDGGQISVMASSDAFRTRSELQFGRGYVPGLK
jgi:NAD(P)-dependent dehydrogenase (short-subunit alcohol dehydrogenase family)